LQYFKGVPSKGLHYYLLSHLDIVGYSDAYWASDLIDRRSTAGYCTFVEDNLVTCQCIKQNIVTRSNAGTEYRVMTHTT